MNPPKTNTISPASTRTSRSRQSMDPDVPVRYIRENFPPEDRLAVLLIQKETNRIIQRVATVRRITHPEFQAWLRHANASHFEVYLGMNPVKANSRTKQGIAEVRHLYLDFDENGTAKVQSLLRRNDLPKPNYLVNTSPGRWHAIWKVEGFSIDEAEGLMRRLVRETGADPAATDVSRLLRLPGFISHKHGSPFLVLAESRAIEVYRREHFPAYPNKPPDGGTIPSTGSRKHRPARAGRLTQSELDWAYAKRALARGENPDRIIAAIERYRRGEKSDPHAYAARTVRKAIQALETDRESDRHTFGR